MITKYTHEVYSLGTYDATPEQELAKAMLARSMEQACLFKQAMEANTKNPKEVVVMGLSCPCPNCSVYC